MARIAAAVEPSLGYRHQLPEASEEPTVGEAMSNAACDLAEALGAQAILVPTYTGRTASAVARLRPRRPILGLTHHRLLAAADGARVGRHAGSDPGVQRHRGSLAPSLAAARESGLVDAGDRVVITGGTAVNIPGSTN